MVELRETNSHQFPDLRVVINEKDGEGVLRFGLSHVPARLTDGLQTKPGNLRQFQIGDYGRRVHFKSGFVDFTIQFS
jgi:hypothetical protein